MRKFLLIAFVMATFITLKAGGTDSTAVELSEEEYFALYNAYVDSVASTFQYDTGTVQLDNKLATLEIPEGFKYLSGENSEIVLTDFWGNPPSDEPSLGMLFPVDSGPNDDYGYAINITYSEEGYIEDEDAKDIDYDELIESMREGEDEVNEMRMAQGYESIHLVGWASPPFYDEVNKKLHWAKELKFGEIEENTLNYNIRVLGRRGYLNLNVIGEMSVLPDVKANIDNILPSVTFNEGHRYADFNPSLDKVAAYGIGGLIAGKVLSKTGILAGIGIFLAKMWKLILIVVVAIGAGIKRFLGIKSEQA
ncbi:MAG: DUF2167 domain-containing protein [Bacteroidota bacterium]